MKRKVLSDLIAAGFRRIACFINQSVEVIPLASRTVALDVPFNNLECDALTLVIDLTVNAGGLGSVVVTVQCKDRTTGKAVTILASAALSAVATTTLKIGRGLTAAANLVANDQVPRDLNINISSNASPVTMAIGMQLIGSR